MKYIFPVITIFLIFGCATKDKYDTARYYGVMEQDSLLASIVTYIFIAPPYTSMKDRFRPEHREFYSTAASRFAIEKYYVAEDGANYFFVIRPGPKSDEKRGAGGHFKMRPHFQLTGFREEFVTPLLPEEEVKKRGDFLFDEMVKGELAQYLTMKMYVQWPNDLSSYDTATYEWKVKGDSVK